MNKKRRLLISEIIKKTEDVSDMLSDVISEENEAYDNIPENLQSGEIGSKMEEVIDLLEQAEECVENARELLEEASA